MKAITVEMLERKIEANQERIAQAQRVIETKQLDIAGWNRENDSFSHCRDILKSLAREKTGP